MADAKKCDRCGNIYEEKTTSIYEVIISDFFSPIIPYSAKRKNKAINLIKDVCDLCPECEESLNKWFNNKHQLNLEKLKKARNKYMDINMYLCRLCDEQQEKIERLQKEIEERNEQK